MTKNEIKCGAKRDAHKIIKSQYYFNDYAALLLEWGEKILALVGNEIEIQTNPGHGLSKRHAG
jgi:hypothetical protein